MGYFDDWFSEDEDDIFMGSPKSKFFDVVGNASNDIVKDELDKIVEKVAIMELMLSEKKDEDFDINQEISSYKLDNIKKVENMKKGLYLEYSGEIISRLDA